MIGNTYTGKQFNEMGRGPFCKVTNEFENHHGFQYKTGLNIDTEDFNPSGECQSGGLYFTDFRNVQIWIDHKFGIFVREILIPDDARVYIESDIKCKADKIVLGRKWNIKDLPVMYDTYFSEAIAPQLSLGQLVRILTMSNLVKKIK